MLPVFREQLQSFVNKLDDPTQLDICMDEMRRIRDAKWASVCQSEGSCCLMPGPDVFVYSEVDLLDRALKALKERDAAGAASLLKDHLSKADQWG